jgi:HK97 family phage portal protein
VQDNSFVGMSVNIFGWEIRRKSTSNHVSNLKLSDFLNYMREKGWYKVSAHVALELYDKNSAVGDSVDTIIESAKNITPVLKQKDSKDYITKHDVLDLLNNPNPLQNYSQFIESALMYKILTGNLFVSAFGNIRRIPSEIFVTPTDTINSHGTGLNYVFTVFAPQSLIYLNKEYKSDPSSGRLIANNLAEMFHVKRFVNYSTTDGYIADSILDSIIYEIEILNNGNNHNLNMLLNGVNLNGIFNVDTMDAKVVDQFKLDLRSYFSGSGNVGKHVVSQGKTITWAPIQMTNKDMEALGNSESVRKIIYDRFQIPSPLRSLGTETYSNYETAQYVLYDKAVLPSINDIFRGLTTAFVKRGVLKPGQEITYDPTSISALQTRYMSEIKTKKDIGVHTINEIRKMFKDEPLGKSCDLLYQTYNMVPIGAAPSTNTGADNTNTDDTKQDENPSAKRFADILRKNGFTEEEIKERVKRFYDDDINK